MVKKLFNNDHYDLIYAQWHEHFDKLEMSRLYKLNELKTEIVICGIFKITKNKNNELLLKIFSFDCQKWTSKFSNEPNVLYLKLFQRSLNNAYSSIMKGALEELLRQFEIIDQSYYGLSKIAGWQVEKIFVDTKLKSAQNKENMTKAFIKTLHENFINKEIYSFGQKIFQNIPSLKQYLYVQSLHLESLRRIEIENKNLLPIVAFLSSESIRDNNIFSKKYWSTGVTLDGYYKCINRLDPYKANSDHILLTNAHWRFIKSLRVSCINNIFNFNWLNKNKLEILSKINDIRKQPTNIVNAFITLVSNTDLVAEDAADIKRYVIFFNALLKEILERKQILQKEDFQALIRFFIKMRSAVGLPNPVDNGDRNFIDATTLYNQIIDIRHFLLRTTQHLNKNSTFNSILNSTREWEKSLSLESREIRKWKSSLIDYQCDNFTIKEIIDERELATEGSEMHHCVSIYADEAYINKYKIFSIKEETSDKRATLGIRKTYNGWILDQVRGYCNATIVSESILSICKDIIKKLNKQF